MAAGSAAVLSAFVLNLCIAVGVFCVFSVIRAKPWCRRFFAPRRFASDLDLKPRRLPNGPLAWLVPLLTYPEEDIIDEAGLDAAMYLRVLRFGMQLFLVLSAWCLLTVLPANLTSGEIDRLLAQKDGGPGSTVNGRTYRFTDFDHFSLTNVEAGSPKLWVHLVAVYGVVGFTLWLLWRFNRESVLLRLMFLGNSKRGGPSHTVLVTDIPGVGQVVALLGSGSKDGSSSQAGTTDTAGETANPSGSNRPSSTVPGMELQEQQAKKRQEAKKQQAKESNSPPAQIPHSPPYPPPPSSLTPSSTTSAAPSPAAAAATAAAAPYGGGGDPSSSPPSLPLSYPAASGAGPHSASPFRSPGFGSSASTPSPAPAPGPAASASPSRSPPRVSFFNAILGTSPQRTPGDAGGRDRGPGAPTASAGSAASGATSVRTLAGTPRPSSRSYGLATAASAPAPAGAALAAGSGGEMGGDGTGVDGNGDGDWDLYAAGTGGRLEAARVGLTREQVIQQLEYAAAHPDDDVGMAVRPEWSVDASPLRPTRRVTKRYKYDLADDSLDAGHQARVALRSGLTPQQLVSREFALVYSPGLVAAVNMVQDTGDLEPLAEEWNTIHQQLEDYLDKLQLRLRLRRGLPHQQLSVLGARYGNWGREVLGTRWFKKVDAVDFWLKRLKYLRGRILQEQEKATARVAPTAFVTFTARKAQAIASSALHHHDVTAWRCQPAPAPFELVWGNLGLTTPVRSGRMYFLWAAFWAMALFFMIPVAAIQALIEVPKLAKVPVLGAIVTAPVVRQIVEAIIPGLALKIFLAIVPIILRTMALLSGATAASDIDFGVVKRYFLFQVIVVFFGNIIAGSFFNQLQQWVNHPDSVVPTLGKSIPMTSTFFITYLLTNGLGIKSLAFIRLPAFVIFWLLSRFAGSPRARQRLWSHQYTDNGTTVVDHTIALLLGLTFSCINPIVCPAALAYFLVTFLGESYNNIYVFRRGYESAGKLWKTVYNQVMVGLYLQQLTMIGLLGIKKFKIAPLLLPLLGLSVACHISTLRLFKRPWSVTALHDAADLDMWEADRRRMELLVAAKKERRARRRRSLPAAAEEAEGGRAPLLPVAARDPGAPGPAERQLLRALRDEAAALALRPEEAAEVVDMYKNPCFKIDLGQVEVLEALAADLLPRLDVLNEWTAALKRHGKKPVPAGAGNNPPHAFLMTTRGEGEELREVHAAEAAEAGGVAGARAGPKAGDNNNRDKEKWQRGREQREEPDPARPPVELTKYDHRPPLDGEGEEDSEAS